MRLKSLLKRPTWQLLSVTFLLHLVGIALFASGFLLTKARLPNISKCVGGGDQSLDNASGQLTSPACSLPAFRKLVVIVIDGLRSDFLLPACRSPPCRDHMPVLSELARQVSFPSTSNDNLQAALRSALSSAG